MEEEEYRLRVMMIKKKHKGLYKSMIKSRKRRVNEAKHLEKKRKVHDEQATENNSAKKKKKALAWNHKFSLWTSDVLLG